MLNFYCFVNIVFYVLGLLCIFHLYLQLQKCIQLDAKLRDMDGEIAVNPQYVQKVRYEIGMYLDWVQDTH